MVTSMAGTVTSSSTATGQEAESSTSSTHGGQKQIEYNCQQANELH